MDADPEGKRMGQRVSEEVIRAYMARHHYQSLDDDQFKALDDGLFIVAEPLLFHWALYLMDPEDTVGYVDRWCYADRAGAVKAIAEWPVDTPMGYEPDGWHRHPQSGRRRENGDKEKEYVAY